MSGALKVRTSVAPDVWTVIGGGSFATNAETIAGTVDTKAITPAGRAAANMAIDPRIYGFATTATSAVNSAALQAAIDEACGSGDPVTTTRYATRSVVIPPGIYKLASPITIRSVVGLEIRGDGNAELRADTNMTSVLDINGLAMSRIGGFAITGTTGVQVDNGIYTYWDNTTASFNNSGNSYHDITIRNLDFITGFRVGKTGSGLATDNDEFHNIDIQGTWATGNTTRWQAGLLLGTTVAANNLVHSVYKFRGWNVRYPIKVENTEAAVYGAGIAGCDTAFYWQPNGYATIDGVDVESAERLFFTPGSTANANVSISNVTFRANKMLANGRWIDFNMAGVLSLRQLFVKIATVTPVIITGPNPIRIEVEGLAVSATTNPTVQACFSLAAQTVAHVRGFAKVNSSLVTTSIENWDSDAATVTPKIQRDIYATVATATWTKPSWATKITLECVGGGGGGGSGRRGAAGTVRCGGGGGGGGAYAFAEFSAADLGATLSVTILAGGAGGAAATADDTNGNGGTAGQTAFIRSADLSVTHIRVPGGGAGGAGTASAGAGGGTAAGMFPGGNGTSASTTGLVGAAGGNGGGGGGGAAGAGITSANAPSAGAAGGVAGRQSGGTGPAAGVGSTNDGATSAVPGSGSGSGASSVTAAGQDGGTSLGLGGGGGGGGASQNGFNSGKGGDGGPARIVITSYGP
jgi:hypothetical protein